MSDYSQDKYVCRPVYSFGVWVTDKQRFFCKQQTNKLYAMQSTIAVIIVASIVKFLVDYFRHEWLKWLLGHQSSIELEGRELSEHWGHRISRAFFALFFDFKSLSEEVKQGFVDHLLYKSEGVTPGEDFVNSLDT